MRNGTNGALPRTPKKGGEAMGMSQEKPHKFDIGEGAGREARRSDMDGRSGPPATRLEKETKMKQPTYKMMKIALADCRPHADAEAYSASSEDRAALSNSIGEAGVLSPIAVIPAEGGDEVPGAECLVQGAGCRVPGAELTHQAQSTKHQKWYVIDGIGRMNALMAAGVEETEAQVFDLGDLSVAEFVVCKNSMMRKVTTGTRVMAYLKCHEREVLAAAEPEKYQSRKGNEGNFKGRDRARPSHAVSHETAWDKGWNAKEIAERLGVSKNDVLAGIELLKAMGGSLVPGAECLVQGAGCRVPGAELTHQAQSTKHQAPMPYEQGDLFETMEAVLRGETPIRRWKAAVCGKMPKTGGKAAADYTNIAIRTVKSLPGVWQNWQTVPMEARGPIIAAFRAALQWLPEDFRAVIAEEISPAETQRRRGQRR